MCVCVCVCVYCMCLYYTIIFCHCVIPLSLSPLCMNVALNRLFSFCFLYLSLLHVD